MYYAKVDLSQVPSARSARDSLAEATFNQLLALLPVDQREVVRADLQSKDLGTRGSVAGFPDNPEAARLLGIIYSIWEADRLDRAALAQRELATRHEAPVIIAAVSRLPGRNVIIRMTRSPGGHGKNIVAILDSELSVLRIAQSLRMLQRSRATHGEFPREGVRLDVKGGALPPASVGELRLAEEAFARLQGAPSSELPGFGLVPNITVSVPPVTSSGAQ
jgi:hypothetical protein